MEDKYLKDRHFWNEYYEKTRHGDNELVETQSSFATFCSKFFEEENQRIIDLGCGNGRDSIYFASQGHRVTSIDVSETAIASLERKKGICALVHDLASLPDALGPVDIAYTRFSIHSITTEAQDKLLAWCANNVEKLICIETRSINDPRCGKGTQGQDVGSWIDTHYRRFLEMSTFLKHLQSFGFTIVKAEEDFFSAHYKEDKAVVLRIIAKKNN